MSNLQKELKEYYKELRSELPGSAKKRKAVIASLKSSIDCYIAENPDASFESIVESFGTAEEIANSNIEAEDSGTIRRQLGSKGEIALIVVAVLLAAALIWGASVTLLNCSASDDVEPYHAQDMAE